MTKKEEIREGLAERIGNCLIEVGCGGGGCPKAERAALDAQENLLKNILDYLHSQGVVIKVDELAMSTEKGWYYLVESLIEEKP